MTTEQDHDYYAYIGNAAGDDQERVDLRTLSSDRLAVLRSDAASHGDTDMVTTIDLITGNEPDEQDTVFCYRAGLQRVLSWIERVQAVPDVPEMTEQEADDLEGLRSDAWS